MNTALIVGALGVTGRDADEALERSAITCNKNGVPDDPEKPTITSGIRLGTPAATSRGFGTAEFREVGLLITEVVDGLVKAGGDENGAVFFLHDRAVRTLAEAADTGVVIDPHHQNIAEAGGRFEVGHVAAVQQVEHTIGEDDGASICAPLRPLGFQ